ncbi:nucleotidyltransferase domain-containing protein [Candidatus Wolfebacteria bacterium]|nr:nucleotidyltransferase domain-containing protein [Candidatus Wolfebacteria bacterium]
MLDLITKSKIRQRIILLFVYNSDRAYYINETAKLVKTSSGTAKRELEKLAKSGFLTRKKKANLVYFKAAISNPLWRDIKDIIDKTIGIERILKKNLENFKNIDFAFLFGSYVKGDFKSDSDID